MRMIKYVLIGVALGACNGGNTASTAQETEALTQPLETGIVAEVRSEPNADCVAYSTLRFAQENGKNLTFKGEALFTGVACSYHPNGNVFTLTNYIEGIREGAWEVYFENGLLEKQGLVQNGKEHGEYTEYYPNGQLKYEYTYDQGAKVGKWRSWYEDGTPYTERNFENDQLTGKVLVWDEKGRLAKEYHYVKGTKINSIMHFKKFED